MKRIRVDEIPEWNIAKKTKNIKAKAAITIMVDRSVTNELHIS